MSVIELTPASDITPAPPIEEVYEAVRRFNYHEAQLWTSHQDSQKPLIEAEHIFDTFAAPNAEKLLQDLERLHASEGVYDAAKYPWIPKPSEIIQKTVGAAELIRRSLSPDSYAISDTLPDESEKLRVAARLQSPKRYMQKRRAKDRVNLTGSSTSIVPSMVRHAEIWGYHKELIPLESQRVYQEIGMGDVDALSHEEPGAFIQLAADILSPIRNEHQPITNDTLQHLAESIAERQKELGPLSEILLLNCWRLAHQNSEPETAQIIMGLMGEGSALRYYAESYEQQEVAGPDEETMQGNAGRFIDEYAESGGDPKELQEGKHQKPRVRMRIKPEALWSIAMRDGGFIRSGDEGAVRETGRGNEGRYAFVRAEAERVLYGDAAADAVTNVPIVYGYYAHDGAEQTPAMRSLVRIYGGVELVFKPDIEVDKRVVYGDSLNAIVLALDAAKKTKNGAADVELIRETVESRIIPEADAEMLAEVISFLHGQEESTQSSPAANPYIECAMRGRLNLSDCEEIRVSAGTFDSNQKLMETIHKLFQVKVVRVE